METEFKDALDQMRILRVTFDSNEKGRITRLCVPFDFGPSRRYKDGENRYHFYDLDSPDGSHNLALLPDQIVSLELTDETFDPADYVTWTPNWFTPRDWGRYS